MVYLPEEHAEPDDTGDTFEVKPITAVSAFSPGTVNSVCWAARCIFGDKKRPGFAASRSQPSTEIFDPAPIPIERRHRGLHQPRPKRDAGTFRSGATAPSAANPGRGLQSIDPVHTDVTYFASAACARRNPAFLFVVDGSSAPAPPGTHDGINGLEAAIGVAGRKGAVAPERKTWPASSASARR